MVGINNNNSLQMQELLIFIHATLTKHLSLGPPQDSWGVPTSNVAQNKSRAEDKDAAFLVDLGRSATTEGIVRTRHDAAAHEHLIGEFALLVLHSFLKRGKLSTKDTRLMEMLDPFTAPLILGLVSKFNKTTLLALKVFRNARALLCTIFSDSRTQCLCYCLRMRIPAARENAPSIVEHALSLLQV